MSDNVGLHDLIGSLAASIVDAQGVVERHFIALVGRYFADDGRAHSLHLQLPDTSSNAVPGSFVHMAVPLLSLVESSMLAIREMQIDLEVELGGIGDIASGTPDAPLGAPIDLPGMLGDDSQPSAGPVGSAGPVAAHDIGSAGSGAPPAKSLTVGVGSRSDTGGPMAKLSIKVEARAPTEGMLRLITQLNKVV
ncbi:DUF2589 domain-containing protein [uncultured Sphingomonas sp.]|uniref:DUF2589 domain-containing protein n=1 Tax=uncultured Sphingomonas sp. TaxID=158754 RepID=UPI0035CAC12A